MKLNAFSPEARPEKRRPQAPGGAWRPGHAGAAGDLGGSVMYLRGLDPNPTATASYHTIQPAWPTLAPDGAGA